MNREQTLQEVADECHQNSLKAGWHTDHITGKPLPINSGTKLMLIVTEIAEAMEGNRKNLMDDKLTHRKMEEVELADAVIRIFDYAGLMGYDICSAMMEKIAFNAIRPDHKIENRLAEGGKKY